MTYRLVQKAVLGCLAPDHPADVALFTLQFTLHSCLVYLDPNYSGIASPRVQTAFLAAAISLPRSTDMSARKQRTFNGRQGSHGAFTLKPLIGVRTMNLP